MKYYYSKSTNAFYPEALRPDYEAAGTWPDDVVEVERGVMAEFSGQPPLGKRRVCVDGVIQWADTPPPTIDDLATRARYRRDALLAATDWAVLRAYEAGEKLDERLSAYRAALRDLPKQSGFPLTINWPSLL